MMDFTQYDAIIEVDTSTEDLAKAMDHTFPAETPQEYPANFNRGRRWSLDAISPKRLFSKRESAPTIAPDIAQLSSPSVVHGSDRRHSSPNVKVKGFKFKQPHRFFHHHHPQHQQRVKRESYLIVEGDNSEEIVITCEDDEHVKELLLHAMMDQHFRSYRTIVSSGKSIMKMDLGFPRRAKSCENLLEATLIDDSDYGAKTKDSRYILVCDMLENERQFHDNIQSLASAYLEPLRNTPLLSKGEHETLLAAIEPLISLSASFVQKLKTAGDTWDTNTTQIGNLFSTKLWDFYRDLHTNFCDAKRFLLDKYLTDSAFKEFCVEKQEQGSQSLEELLTLPVTRVSDYGKYLSELLQETDPSHPDYKDLSQAITKVNSMITEREDEIGEEEKKSSMEVVAERPSHLEINHHITSEHSSNNNTADNNEEKNKLKGLSLRRMSAPSALLFKSLAGYRSKTSNSLWSNNSMGKRDVDFISQLKMAEGESNRIFVMEGPVQFATGVQVQERYLFLFNDLLLVTKQKSNTTFKLKHRVRLCDMWIASCIEEVAEITRPADQSFVIGWPTLNVVATFPQSDIKEYWLTKLKEHMQVEKFKEKDKLIQLRVAPRDLDSTPNNVCQVPINNQTEAKDVLLACLTQIHIQEHEAKEYQLWVLSGKEGSPYPLIGHEIPFSIKLSHIRGLSRSPSGDDIDNMTAADLDSMVNNSSSAGQKCEFYLKQKKTRKNQIEDSTFSKSAKKNKKSPNIFHTLFRKKRPTQHLVFGLPLSEVCDENLDPPESIIKLMVLVYQQGPHTPGILRRGNKATLSKDIREKIDSGDMYTLEDHMAPTAASVFKEFLRSVPDGLLVNDMYEQWSTVKKDDPYGEKINKIKTILAKLPPAHYRLIKLTISLLQHLAKHSHQNQMGPTNLATCIAPSFYTHGADVSPFGNFKGEALKQMQMQNSVLEIQNVIVPLLSFMIINHVEIFGEDILNIFTKYGCEVSPAISLNEDRPGIQMQPSLEEDEQAGEDEDDMEFSSKHSRKHHMLPIPQREQMQRDSNSGTDSDSMHSILSMQETEMGLQQNNSSTDSLVDREYFSHEADSSPRAAKSHISPSNLSRDSGLTLSDTQLYDEEICPGDSVNMPTKLYQRSASHFIERENMEAYNQINYYQNHIGQFDRAVNPVAAPRKRVKNKGKDSNEESDGELNGYTAYFSQRVPYKHSVSTTQLDNNKKICSSGELLTHPLLGNRVSSDSIGEEGEILDDQYHPLDFERMRAATDIGTVLKSESGTHLYLNNETVPIKYSLTTPGNKYQRRFVRQSSVTDSTPPISPQSRYSQSSRDSAISESACSVSRDGSIHSAPHTPDEPQDKSLVWVSATNTPAKSWDDKLFNHNQNLPHSLAYSKSTSDLLSESAVEENCFNYNTSENMLKVGPSSPKLWPGKSHEAEEIEMNSRPHFKYVRSGNYSTDPFLHISLTSPQHNTDRKQWLTERFNKGSPPPNVILQTLQNLPRKDSVPVKASYDSANPLHAGFSNIESFDPSMNSVRHEEYLTVTSKPIIISPPGDSLSSTVSTASRRARLSKYTSSSIDLPLSSRDRDFDSSESKRPEKPPNYQQAIERNFLIKHNKQLDSVQAKRINEPGQVNSEQRNAKPKEVQTTPTMSNTTLLLNQDPTYRISPSDVGKIITSNQTNTNYADSSLVGYASEDSVQSTVSSERAENERNSGYKDISSISHSLQKDVGGYSTQVDGLVGSSSRNISSKQTSSVSLSRNGSNFSQSSSGSGKSVATSVLDKHFQVLGHHSNLGDNNNIPLSSPAYSDDSSKTNPIRSKHRTASDLDHHSLKYAKHFHTTKLDVSGKIDPACDIMENEISDENMATGENNSHKPFFKSTQIYEQKSSRGVASNFQLKKSLTTSASSPFPNSHYHQQQQASGISHKSSISPFQEPNTPKGRPVESTKSRLEATNINLYRNRSVSVEQLHKLGASNLLSTKSKNEFVGYKQTGQRPLSYNEKSNEIVKMKPQLKDIKSELHQNFLLARSRFNKSEDNQRASPVTPTHHLTHQSLSLENRLNKWPSQSMTLTSAPEDMTVESALLPGSGTKVFSKGFNHPQNASMSEYKKEFHWSVKDLKSIYDKSKDFGSSNTNNDSSNSNREPTSQSSQSQPRSPPPYQNPPPFRNIQDTSTLSISTTGSKEDNQLPSGNNTSPNTVKSHKLGPQSFAYDASCSYCSSEDGYSSSLDRNSTMSVGSSLESEALSDYTNITYV